MLILKNVLRYAFMYSAMFNRHGKMLDICIVWKSTFSLSVYIIPPRDSLHLVFQRSTVTSLFYFCLKSENLWTYCISSLTANINLCVSTQVDFCSDKE